MARQPNVLFIITDQQRADHNGFMGNDVVRTPHLDALAARGTVFANAWVSNPVCMPNRSTILTGRMPTAHGEFRAPRDGPPTLAVRRTHGESVEMDADLGPHPVAAECRHFVDAVRESAESVLTDGSEAVATLRILDAARASLATGAAVTP